MYPKSMAARISLDKDSSPPAMLLITLGQVKGGVESYLERLTDLLLPSVELYCLCVFPQTAADLRKAGANVTLLPQVGRWTKSLGFVLTLFYLPYLVIRNRIRIVQLNGLLEAVFLLEARLLGRRSIYTRHGPFEDDLYTWRQPRQFLPRFLAHSCARAASLLICVSADTYASLDSRLKPKSIIIPHWITPPSSVAPQALSLVSPARILCVCRLEKYKGVQLVIEAVRYLPNIELTVVGDGGYRNALEELSRGLNARFVGYQNDPSAYLLNADLFIMPSFGPEGSSLAALEAMSYGLPCILSDLPVYKELAVSGEAVLHFRSGDVADLRTKIDFLLNNDNARLTLAKNGRALVEQAFHPDGARQAYLGVLNTLVE